MLPRKRLALTLVAAGALACTTVSAPPSFAADAHEAEAASNTGVSLDAQQTVIGLFAFKGVGGVGIRRSGGGSVGGSFGG